MEEVAQIGKSTQQQISTIVLVGNPNSGKSSLFNQLTGLRQKVGNYPGITVDKKSGIFSVEGHKNIRVIDLPGNYSIYPRAKDEKIVVDILSNSDHDLYPDLVIVIVDASNLKRNLLLLNQIQDLGIPVICALNMVDIAEKKGVAINSVLLQEKLQIPVVPINARTGKGIPELKLELSHYPNTRTNGFSSFIPSLPEEILDRIKQRFAIDSSYLAVILLNQTETIDGISVENRQFLRDLKKNFGYSVRSLQNSEILNRYTYLNQLVDSVVEKTEESARSRFTGKLDKVFTHKVYGYLVFFTILYVIFQAIFSWAEIPMDWIDTQFANLSMWVRQTFPEGIFVKMIAEGIIPGIGGIAIFVPQIAMLFAFIAILEDTGYMARVVFLMDKVMRKFGLSGKSIVPLISGVACAIPAVMATRNIESWKERLISIMVTPLMTCSARLPVYVILISLVVPNTSFGGIMNLQGLTLLGLYMLGFLAALFAAFVFHKLVKSSSKSFLIMEMPTYKAPRWKNVAFTMFEKSRTFVVQAGKIIIAISLILWILASFGPKEQIKNAEIAVANKFPDQTMEDKEFRNYLAAYKLEHSYAAVLGKSIEPVIRPLGFDWKIGIALITSFAAREVFVSTIATIYSVGEDADDPSTIKQKMLSEINPDTGEKVFTTAVAFSLLVFYAFAMQCMSTLAIVYRETKSIKWPLIQFAYMSVMAYVASLVVFQVLSRL